MLSLQLMSKRVMNLVLTNQYPILIVWFEAS